LAKFGQADLNEFYLCFAKVGKAEQFFQATKDIQKTDFKQIYHFSALSILYPI